MTGGKTCGSCGARNATSADFCWRCYARFGAAPGAVPAAVGAPVAVGVPSGIGTADAARAAAMPAPMPPAAPPWQTTSRFAERGRLPEPIPETRWPVRRFVNMAVLALVALGAFLGWRHFMGDPFPSSIRGLERLEAQPAKLFEQSVREAGDAVGANMHGAIYGQGGDVALMAILSDKTGSAEHLGGPMQLGAEGQSPFTTGRPVEFERDGASFQCTGVRGEAQGAVCLWTDLDTVGMVFAAEMTVDAGMELAAAVRSAVI